ncbi:uncharacterized protein F5891DRAFT_1213482 [Suillus fuscotomentosus]|uniref:Uncharacterized protein n=1 Tax=Suillus fuscotomentosus TaxID=1912939 RepID=A0AAD4HNX7_9AGAM|nr:uncharacterized protein F5891DRAFT_1213482 [Suillus fuscotomentosus]KAG1903221.1 hypothetical protein F5891DRAFT_1213482 [Suillus fuscotomentosus]
MVTPEDEHIGLTRHHSDNFPSASCPALDSLTSLAHQTHLFRFWQCLNSLNKLAVKPSTTGTSQSVIRHPTPQGTFEAWDVESQTLGFDESTLKTVGAPLEGHTWIVLGLVLSFDDALLANASSGKTINSSLRESTSDLTTLSSSHQLGYYPNWNAKIHIYDIPSDILTSVWPTQKEHCLLHSSPMCRALHYNHIRIAPIAAYQPPHCPGLPLQSL